MADLVTLRHVIEFLNANKNRNEITFLNKFYRKNEWFTSVLICSKNNNCPKRPSKFFLICHGIAQVCFVRVKFITTTEISMEKQTK